MECLAVSQLADLLSGSATPDLTSHIDAHVDRCADCRQLLLNLARAISSPSRPPYGAPNDAPRRADPLDQLLNRSSDPSIRRYRILGLLGEGGMGRVHRAYDRLLGTEVALKQVLLPSPSDDWSSPASLNDTVTAIVSRDQAGRIARHRHDTLARLKMLAEEFRTLATLHHPHIVSVFDYGFDGEGRPFYTMELLPGAQPLLQFARGRSLVEQAELMVQLLDALAYLHRRGVVHRDLSPSNVLVVHGEAGPVAKIVDFGLAVDAEGGTDLSTAGTLLYMAPELFRGERASELSDLYAVGVMAYQMFTGAYPFSAEDGTAALLQQILAVAPALARLPAAMKPVIGQALSKAPSRRQADAATLRRELAAAAGLALSSEPVATRDSYLIAARFVGRQAELRALQEALSAARQSAGSAWLIYGESGVGKSRLLEELRSGALRAGVLALRGQAMPGGDAYHLWREVLKLLALQVPLDDLEAGILSRLLPELPMLLESAVLAPQALDPSGARLRLFHVVEALLARLPGTALVMLEDLQWADSESLALLSHLASGVSGRALLLIATYREEEGPQTAAALPQLRKLRLPRLDRREMEQLCESMLGPIARNRALVDRVATETEGNAYFIVEVMRALAAERGSLAEIGIGGLPERLFAGGIAQVLDRRLSRAPAAARPLLQLSAIAGRELDPRLLAQLLPDIEAQISALADVGLLELHLQRWQFSHDKLRERVRDSLSGDDRKRLHQRIAEALVQVYPGDESRLAQVAIHYREAHEPIKAAHFYALSGDAALRRGAPSEAAALLEQARLLHAQATMPRLAEVRLWRGLTEARFGLGRLRESEVALRQLCAAAGTPLPTDPLRLWSMVGRLAAELLAKRLGLLAGTSLPDPDQRAIAAELLTGLGVEEVFVWTDQPELALLCTLFGLRLEDQLGMAPRRNYHRSALFFILSHTPLRGLCLRYIEYIERRDADVLSGTHAEIDFLRVRALVELNDGQLERAAEHAAQAVALARTYKDDFALLNSLLQLQLAAAGLCDFAQMLAASREMEPLAVRAENARYLALAYVGQGAAQLNLGEYADAAVLLEKARAYLPQELGPIPESVTLALIASARRNMEQFDRAAELANQALSSVLRARWSLVQLRYPLGCILDAYLMAPQPQHYAAQIELALAKLQGLARRFPQAVPDALLFGAVADWRCGRPTKRTAESFRKSIATASKLGMKLESAMAQYWFGCFAQSRVGAPLVREGAQAHLHAALVTFEQLKSAGMVTRTRAALQGLQKDGRTA